MDVSQGPVASYTFSDVTADGSITASFAINTYTIAVTQSANGVINPGTSTVNYGDTPTFAIAPNANYHISSITANGVAVAVTSPSGQTYQFSSVSTDGSLTATFASNTETQISTQTSTTTSHTHPSTPTPTPKPTTTHSPTPTQDPTTTPKTTPAPTPLYVVLISVIIFAAIIILLLVTLAARRLKRKMNQALPKPETPQ